jgi:gluconolactonase
VIAVETRAARIPGPPELLPGRPDAVVDLQAAEGVALVGGQWRYSDCRVEEIEFVEPGSAEDPLGPGTLPNRTYDVVPHAEAADFDDSGWRVLAPGETMLRLANGRVCFNWYRIAVTVPERVGDFDPTGSTVVFEVVVDDYAEVWVNGELPLALGDRGGNVAAGFNAPNRVVLTRDARPGDRFVLAVFGINGPISASPRNYIWVRNASLDFYAPARARISEDARFELEGDFPADGPLERIAGGFERVEALLPMRDGSLLVSAGPTVYRWHDGAVTVFRSKADAAALTLSREGLLTIAQSDRVIRVNPHGDTSVLADGLERPRALLYDADGSLLVGAADGIRRGAAQISGAQVCALARDGVRVVALDADGGVLAVDASGVDVLYDLEDEPCGLAVDQAGRLYVAGALGVSIFTPDGDRLGALRLPERPGALAFQGSDLVIAAETSVYRIRLSTKGAS